MYMGETVSRPAGEVA